MSAHDSNHHYTKGTPRPAHLDPLSTVERKYAAEREARRARVLAHPDIAIELTWPPLSYPTPEDWNGYIPPAYWNGRLNDSIRRSALMAILNTVVQVEREAAA